MTPPRIEIHPPLVNSANPWATTLEDLERLYTCPHTGAVTTRTSLINAFPHDPFKHQYAFFSPASHTSSSPDPEPNNNDPSQTASLNTLGYSPLPLETYLTFIKEITTPSFSPASSEADFISVSKPPATTKPFIISVTGTPTQVADSYRLIALASSQIPVPLYMEINLSCPNIPDKPPPAYSKPALLEYLAEMRKAISSRTSTAPTTSIKFTSPVFNFSYESRRGGGGAGGGAAGGTGNEIPRVPYGLKTPPYTYATQFRELVDALAEDAADGKSEVSFVTATNTLGSCLLLGGQGQPVLPGEGVGGMAGTAIHPLALGNVKSIRALLDERAEKLGHITIIGVGGVMDADGYKRMKGVGAGVVGVGTGIGVKGLKVFEDVSNGLGGKW